MAKRHGLYFGRGFRWQQQHTQALATLAHADGFLPTAEDAQGGIPAFAAAHRGPWQDIWLDDTRLEGHVGILSMTGAGKSVLLRTLFLGSIPQRGPTIILDPKFDRLDTLCLPAALAARRAGRRFALFAPAFPEFSAPMNMLHTAQTANEVTARIQALMPSGGSSRGDPFFEEFSLALIHRVAAAQQACGIPWTLEGIYRACIYPNERRDLLFLYLGLLGCMGPQLRERKDEYKKAGFRDLVADGLLHDDSRDPDHFQKVTASMDPAFRGVIGHPYGELFSSLTTDLTWQHIVEEEMVLYVGLSSLMLGTMANRSGRVLLQDFVGYLGRRFSLRIPSDAPTIRVFIDEFGDVMYPLFIHALNKGRSPGARFVLCMQSKADAESASNRVEVQRVFDNLGTRITMRLGSEETAMGISEGFGMCEVVLPDTRVGQTMGGQGGLTANVSRGLVPRPSPLLPHPWFMALPRGHAFMRLDGVPWYLQVPSVTTSLSTSFAGLDLPALDHVHLQHRLMAGAEAS